MQNIKVKYFSTSPMYEIGRGVSFLKDGMMEPKIAIQCHYQLVLHQIKKLFLEALLLYNFIHQKGEIVDCKLRWYPKF